MKTRHTFGATAVIPAGGYYILGDTAVTSPTPDEVTTTASTLDLGNGNTNADAVQLLDCDGELIDVIVYGKTPNSDGWIDETGALVAPLLAAGAGTPPGCCSPACRPTRRARSSPTPT